MKIESGKRIIFFIVFAIIGILAVLIYNISVMILFTDEKKLHY